MKKIYLFYCIVTLAIIALGLGVISYATQTRDTQTPQQQARVETPTPASTTQPTVKKKSCDCCAERIARLKEQIRKARERRMAAQQAGPNEILVSQQKPTRASDAP